VGHISQKIQFYKFLDHVCDLILCFVAIILSTYLESLYHNTSFNFLNSNSFQLFSIPMTFIVSLTVIYVVEGEFLYRFSTYYKILVNTLCIILIVFFILASFVFIFKLQLFFRTTLIFFTGISLLLYLLKRCSIKYYLSYLRKQGMDSKNIMIVGYEERAKSLINTINRHSEFGLIVKAIVNNKIEDINVNSDITIGSIENISKIAKEEFIDEVFFCCPINSIEDSENLFDYLRYLGVTIHVIINLNINKFLSRHNMKPVVEDFYGVNSITYNSLNTSYYKLVIKNIIERTFCLILIFLLFPLCIIVMLLVVLTSKGPAIFVQDRVGLRGRIFKQYKFRTMIEYAELKKEELKDLNELDGPIFKIKKDPRLTILGRFLRKFSIDELPQLLNVIKGDMNLIGPRPYPVKEVEDFRDKTFFRRHSMKPGITGLWQIQGRSDIKNFQECIDLDLEYIDNWCLKNDLIIALKTIPTIIKGTGR